MIRTIHFDKDEAVKEKTATISTQQITESRPSPTVQPSIAVAPQSTGQLPRRQSRVQTIRMTPVSRPSSFNPKQLHL